VVEYMAPLVVHVMVEKPLAVNLEHAQKMYKLAKKHDIHLLTNYETTWYPSNHRARDIVKSGKLGDIRKLIVRDGHKGPSKLGYMTNFWGGYTTLYKMVVAPLLILVVTAPTFLLG
jgi:predicted dehydrogenase